MKKSQRDFTTPDESMRLLGLGIPADSSDCYYQNALPEPKIIPYGRKYQEYINSLKGMNREIWYFKPCWSVGRLIEIFSKCYTGAKCYYSPRNLYKVEFWVERFNRLTIIGFIDFSKLEEWV